MSDKKPTPEEQDVYSGDLPVDADLGEQAEDATEGETHE